MLYPMKWENEWPVVGPEGRPGERSGYLSETGSQR